MAHECFECGLVCYCDLDDIMLPTPFDCRHRCEPEVDEYDGCEDDGNDGPAGRAARGTGGGA